MSMPRLGAHVSIAGGLHRAIERGSALGCEALQIFVKNASQWVGKALTGEDVEAFRAARRAAATGPIVAHASYLINLAAPDPDNLARSRAALGDELDRCARLGLEGLVVHPGAHMGAGEEAGLAAVAASLDAVLAPRPDLPTRLLLENTAGQGSTLGYRLAQLARIRALARCGARLGVCLDTCHAFAAGYALDEPGGLAELLLELERELGLASLGCVHLNDSRCERGARRDRHANIGDGRLGREAFARLLAEPRLAAVPMVLETPYGEDEQGHARDLALLRSLRDGATAIALPPQGTERLARAQRIARAVAKPGRRSAKTLAPTEARAKVPKRKARPAAKPARKGPARRRRSR